MANTRSAQKRNRQALKRRARNSSVKSEVKHALKKARAAIEKATKGDDATAKQAISAATRLLDRAATKGVLHAKNASRHVGRLAHALASKAKAATAAR